MKHNTFSKMIFAFITLTWKFKRLLMVVAIIAGCNASYAQSWLNVGTPGFSAGPVYYTAIAIDGGGTPYVVYADGANSFKTTVMKYSGGSWITVGSAGFSAVAESGYNSIAIDGSGTPYVAYEDGLYGPATVMKFNGSSWVTVGSAGFSAGPALFTSIAIDGGGTPYVVYMDTVNEYKATVMKFDGSNWVTVGSAGFSAGEAVYTGIAIDANDTPFVVYKDFGRGLGGKATVMKFNGANWVTVGNVGFSGGRIYYPSIAIDKNDTPYVVYQDWLNYLKATVMKYDGSRWVLVGRAGFSTDTVGNTAIAIDGSGTPYVVYQDWGDSAKATVMEYNGSGWVTVGSSDFSAGEADYTCIAIDGSGIPYVVYADAVNDYKTTVMSFGTPSGVKNINIPAITGLSIFPNPAMSSFTVYLSTPTNEDARITITNIICKKIKECTISTNQEIEIQLNAPPGIYFLSAVTDRGTQSAKVVVK